MTREKDNGSYTCIAVTVPLSVVSVLNAVFSRGSDSVQCVYFVRLGFLVVSRVVSDDWKAVNAI